MAADINEPVSCETGVRDYEKLYKLLVTQLKDFAVFLIDPSGCITTWNEGVRRLLGYEEHEFVGKPAHILFVAEDVERNAHLQELKQAAEDGRAGDERWHLRKDGSRFYCDGVVTSLVNDRGAVVGFSKVMRDATDRKLLEDQLHELAHALENAQVFIRDGDGRIRIWTRGAERLYGYTKDEAVGRFSQELLQVQFPRSVQDIQRELLVSGEWHGELRQRHKNGGWLTIRSDWTVHRREGAQFVVVEANTDVTELRQSEERYRTAFTHVPVGMAITTTDGRIMFVNPAYCETIGYTAEELKNRGFLSLTHPDDVPHNQELHRQLIAGEIPSFALEKRYIRKNGGTVWVRAAATLLRESGGVPAQIVAIVEDIQHRKNAEAALLRANKELTEFAHVVAHDLQTPLRAVRSYTELLERRWKGQIDGNSEQYIRFILDGARAMDELIRALLRYAEAGGDTLDRERVPVETVVDSVLLAVKADIDDSHAVVSCSDLPQIDADRIQLMQVFQNLIGNALKYRQPNATPRILVEAEEEHDAWLFSVKDNGIGIERSFYDRIFRPLERVHGKEVAGTGIGLAVCRKIVERHGGRIWVESELGRGSTFRFTIPK